MVFDYVKFADVDSLLTFLYGHEIKYSDVMRFVLLIPVFSLMIFGLIRHADIFPLLPWHCLCP